MKSYLKEIKRLKKPERIFSDLRRVDPDGTVTLLKDIPKEELPLWTFDEMIANIAMNEFEQGRIIPALIQDDEEGEKARKQTIDLFIKSKDIEKINIGTKGSPEYRYRLCP